MTKKNKEILVKRLKSFAWRTGLLVVAIAIDFTLENIGLLELPPLTVAVIGLVLGEVSKYLNR
jgi:hypothetical protein